MFKHFSRYSMEQQCCRFVLILSRILSVSVVYTHSHLYQRMSLRKPDRMLGSCCLFVFWLWTSSVMPLLIPFLQGIWRPCLQASLLFTAATHCSVYDTLLEFQSSDTLTKLPSAAYYAIEDHELVSLAVHGVQWTTADIETTTNTERRASTGSYTDDYQASTFHRRQPATTSSRETAPGHHYKSYSYWTIGYSNLADYLCT